MILSSNFTDANLLAAGYVKLAKVDLGDVWEQRATTGAPASGVFQRSYRIRPGSALPVQSLRLWSSARGIAGCFLGGLSFEPFQVYGLIYQAGGMAALGPGRYALPIFALKRGSSSTTSGSG